MRSSSRAKILEAAIAVAGSDSGERLTLDAVAATAGVTKPGLRYHFPSKQALLRAVVSYLADQWVELMCEYLPVPHSETTVRMRVTAYIEAATSEKYARSDFTIYGLASRSPELRDVWNGRMDEWIGIPTTLDEEERTRLTLARIAADGYWFTKSTEMLTPPAEDLPRLRAAILRTLEN